MGGLRKWLLAFLLLLPAGCTSGGAEHDPIARTLTWYSYLNGDDLRAACTAGATDRYRLVYNAIWTEQVRTYEVVVERPLAGTQAVGKAPGAELTARAFTPAPIFNVYLDTISGRQPVAESSVGMTPDAVSRFRRHLSESGFDKPPPAGTWLRSDRFYWLAAGCTDGQFNFNAWPMTHATFDGLHFIADLLAHDQTGREFAEPRAMPKGSFSQTAGINRNRKIAFRIQVGPNGLVGQ